MSNFVEIADFLEVNLKAMCVELRDMRKTGTLKNEGLVMQLAHMCQSDEMNADDAIWCVTSLVRELAVDFVVNNAKT